MVIAASLIIVGIAAAPIVTAQQQIHPSFEVVSIKPSAIPAGREGGNRAHIEHTPDGLTMSNVSLSDCVQWAYGVAFFQLSSDGLSADTYDVRAKAVSPVTVAELRMMLQDLLSNRFKLALHRETKMLPVYELVVAKGGPKLSPANGDVSRPLVYGAESLPRVRGDSFLFSDVSMAEFAQMLTKLRGIDLPVVDRTRIIGTFDIVLKSAPAAAREADSAALFAIIRDQLGLRLSSARAPIEVLVIDHVEKPSVN
jgi:uncharacterized protein (TIGR03435 family)